MSLTTPEKVRQLRRALYAKAKAEPEARFHALYDKVYRDDILAHAYRLCRHHGGAAGVDGITFGAIESDGVERWLGKLANCPLAASSLVASPAQGLEPGYPALPRRLSPRHVGMVLTLRR